MLLRTLFFWVGMTLAAVAGPTNAILFVTQVPIPADFTSIGSTFGNHLQTLDACGRGGDLYVLYPDGTVKNLTRAAGYGQWGAQDTNGIAVRQPCVYWDGKKAVFSMVVGAPTHQFDYSASATGYWQLYEITNFTNPSATPVITTKLRINPRISTTSRPSTAAMTGLFSRATGPATARRSCIRSWMNTRKHRRSPGCGAFSRRTRIYSWLTTRRAARFHR